MEQSPVHNIKFKLVDEEKSKESSSDASSKWITKNSIGITLTSKPSINLEPKSFRSADDAAFDFFLSTSLNLVLWTGEWSIYRVVPIGCEIHDVIL